MFLEAVGKPAGTGCGTRRPRQAAEHGFTLAELLIVVAVLGILSSVAIPNMMKARTRAEMTAMLAEARLFQQALVKYHADFGHYPSAAEFDKGTLEPLVSLGYLKSASLLGHCRDATIHTYGAYAGVDGASLEWHVHPKRKPYDEGKQNMKIQGNGSAITITYMGKQFDSASILPLIR